MHHAHVKRKETQMNRYMMEEFYSDPALRHRLFEKARQERARSIREGWAWLRKQLTPRFDFNFDNWTQRLG
jgi:hypothetical protein